MPKTPELNKMVERMNQIVMERVRCMLAHAKFPKTYWIEALKTIVYMINISPLVPLEGDIPQRVWTDKDVSYRHLRVFGCLACVHVAKDKRGKLAPKSRPCIFLGYGEDKFRYQLWDVINKKVIRSRDIVVMEEKVVVDWEMKRNGSSSELTERM